MQISERRMDEWMGRLLQAGVLLSAALVFAGGVRYVLLHDLPPTDYRHFAGEPGRYRTLSGIWAEARQLHARGLIQLGLLVLIATPIARVLYSVIAFALQRDWKYVVITLIVLAVLCYSLFGRHGG
jgi:uncharacterized membrane protein